MFHIKCKRRIIFDCVVLLIFCCGCLKAQDVLRSPNVLIVVGKVEQVTEISDASMHSVVVYKNWSGLTPPAFEARCIVEEVLKGPSDLVGKHAYGMTRDEMMIGNIGVIVPSLKAGEIGIFPVYAKGDHLYFLSNVGYPVAGGGLPSVRGRDPYFETLLRLLIKRRDHPEQNEAERSEAQKEAPHPLSRQAFSVTLPATSETAVTIKTHHDISIWWSGLGVLVILLSGGWVWRRNKHR